MRLVLESHPSISCLDEDQSYRLLLGLDRWRTRRLLGRCRASGSLGLKIPLFTEQLLDRRVRYEEFGSFRNFYRHGHRILFMHRDVRDVVASMLRLEQPDGGMWIDRYGRRILAERMRERTFAARYAHLLAWLKNRDFPPHAVAALYWCYKSEAYLDYRAAGLPVLGVRYERLVHQPEQTLRAVLEFLGSEWSECVLSHPAFRHGELRSDGLAIGGTDPKRAIDTTSVGNFSDVLRPGELSDVQAIAGPTAERLNAVLRI